MIVSPSSFDFRDARDWLADFRQKKGRPLRVLHIGNIANNAYNNAKIQRERGIDAYVAALDYYHVMATPEWEDADFVDAIADPYFPDWWNVNLRGFRRPKWFVAGPIDLSIRYLSAVVRGRAVAPIFWRALEFERRFASQPSSTKRIIRRIIREVLPTIPLSQLWRERISRILRAEGRPEDAIRKSRALPIMSKLEADQVHGLPPGTENFIDNQMEVWTDHRLGGILREFDIVQCYATYTAIPFLINFDPYIAYEHGTLRQIPFENDPEGRLCAASYRAAARVCVTNIDNVPAAKRLGIANDKIVRLPHAFDDKKLLRFAEVNRSIAASPHSEPVFFTPSRQDWIARDPGTSKNNDFILHALKILKDEGRKLRLSAVAWGNDLDASKRLAASLGVDQMVEWVPMMNKKDLWKRYLRSNAVLDQFLAPALGGASFEAMILGRRLISRLDAVQCADFFGEAPPILLASNAEEIATAMRRVLDDPNDTAEDGKIAQAWMQKYHSADRITALQVEAYRHLVAA